jgi:serine/threonine protein kinase
VSFGNEVDVSRGISGRDAHILAFDGGYRVRNADGSFEFFTFMHRGEPIAHEGLQGAAHRAYTQGVFEGMQTLHNHGFVHRDIKRENALMVNGQGALIDLGLAAQRKNLGPRPLTVGSWLPEEFSSRKRYDEMRAEYLARHADLDAESQIYDPKKQDIFNFSVLYLDTKLAEHKLLELANEKELMKTTSLGNSVVDGEQLLENVISDYPNLLSAAEQAVLRKTMKNNPFERGTSDDLAQLYAEY